MPRRARRVGCCWQGGCWRRVGRWRRRPRPPASASARHASGWVVIAGREAGLRDRSSAPVSRPHKTAPEREELIVLLRELRFSGPEIAETIGMPVATVSAILKRRGLGKLPRLDASEPPNRYERPQPGELIHIDVKKLGKIGRPGHRVNGNRRARSRGIGWEFVHVAVDDATRLAYVEVLADEKARTAVGFLRRAIAW